MKNKKNNEIRIFLNKTIGFLSLLLFSIGSGFSLGEKSLSFKNGNFIGVSFALAYIFFKFKGVLEKKKTRATSKNKATKISQKRKSISTSNKNRKVRLVA